MEIKIKGYTGTFAENKDTAKDLRENILKPMIEIGEPIILNFSSIDSTTQSFVHALISDIFQTNGEAALEFIEFKSCNTAVKSLIRTVINYSLD